MVYVHSVFKTCCLKDYRRIYFSVNRHYLTLPICAKESALVC